MNEHAKKGQIYVCGACGKTSQDLYGFSVKNGWDASCMMNAVLCVEKSLVTDPKSGLVTFATPVKGKNANK